MRRIWRSAKQFLARAGYEPRGLGRILFAALSLTGLVSGAGCTWAGRDSTVIVGPAFYRYNTDEANGSMVDQVRIFPVALEGGRQWGIHAGYFDRTKVSCATSQETAPDSVVSGFAVSTNTVEWHWSPFYLKLRHPAQPELIQRLSVGLTMNAGREATGFTFGGSRTIEVTPESECWYEIDYNTRTPMKIRFRKFQSDDGETIQTLIKHIKHE